MSQSPTNQLTDKPSPDDVVRVRFVLPRSMVKQNDQDVEICSCVGSKICVPQSILKIAESRPEQDASGSAYVLFEISLSRDSARLFQSLAAEISRLTREVTELRDKANT